MFNEYTCKKNIFCQFSLIFYKIGIKTLENSSNKIKYQKEI